MAPSSPPRRRQAEDQQKYHYKQAQEVKLTLGSVYLEEDIWTQHHQPPEAQPPNTMLPSRTFCAILFVGNQGGGKYPHVHTPQSLH